MTDYTHDDAMADLDSMVGYIGHYANVSDGQASSRLTAYIERLEAEVEFWQKHGNVAQTIHDLTAERDEWERVARLLAGRCINPRTDDQSVIDDRIAWAREQVDND